MRIAVCMLIYICVVAVNNKDYRSSMYLFKSCPLTEGHQLLVETESIDPCKVESSSQACKGVHTNTHTPTHANIYIFKH